MKVITVLTGHVFLILYHALKTPNVWPIKYAKLVDALCLKNVSKLVWKVIIVMMDHAFLKLLCVTQVQNVSQMNNVRIIVVWP